MAALSRRHTAENKAEINIGIGKKGRAGQYFLLVFFFGTMVCQILIGLILVIAFKLPLGASVTIFWVMHLGNRLLLFIIVPFVLGFPQRTRPYAMRVRRKHLISFIRNIFVIQVGLWWYTNCWIGRMAIPTTPPPPPEEVGGAPTIVGRTCIQSPSLEADAFCSAS